MADLALNSDKDLDFSTNNLILLEGANSISQQISIRLQFFKGEEFYDQRIGIDYFGKILIKNPLLNVVSAILKQAVQTTPGISQVNDFNLDLETPTRTLNISFRAVTDDDEVLNFDESFIIL